MRGRDSAFYLKKAAQGIFVSLFLAAALFIPRRDVLVAQMLLYETMPNYNIETEVKSIFGLERGSAETVFQNAAPDNLEADSIVDLPAGTDVIGLMDDIYQLDDKTEPVEHTYGEALTEEDFDKLADVSELKSRLYAVEAGTDMTAADFDVQAFMAADLTLNRDGPGPKVLVFHTHLATETYVDSADDTEGVMALGAELCRILKERYGIEAIHATGRYDMEDGKEDRYGSYERMEPEITRILAENPTIELAIDLHRDGVKDENTRFVTEVDGKPTAQLMFVNGLSKRYVDGVLTQLDSLSNPNRGTNLALSFRAQLTANKLYPGLMRRIYLKPYRYSLHMLPKSLLVEVGAQTNTKTEALNAMSPLADVLAEVVLD